VVDNPSAHGALEAFFDARPDIIESINFNGKAISYSMILMVICSW
jgi:hypothetical protein